MSSPRPEPPVLLLATNAALAYSTTRCLQDDNRDFRLLARGRYLPVRASRWCRGGSRFTPDWLTDERLAHHIADELSRHQLAAVLPAGIEATLYLGKYQHLLPSGTVFPLSPYELLAQLNDKWRFFQLLSSLGLPQPRTFLIASLADLDDLPLVPPMVVKPLAAEASQGVLVAQSLAELRERVEVAVRTKRLPLLVQEFIDGEDQGASALVDHGKVLGCRVQKGQPGQSLEYVDEPDVGDLVEAIAVATGYHGVLDLDFRRDRSGALWTTECNPRLFFSIHMSAWTGVNMVGMGLRMLTDGVAPVAGLVATSVLSPTDGLRARLRRAPMSEASRAMLRAEGRDPLASLARRLENVAVDRAPKVGARILDEPPPEWSGSWG